MNTMGIGIALLVLVVALYAFGMGNARTLRRRRDGYWDWWGNDGGSS